MYEHVTRFIEDIDLGGFDEAAFTHALYEPEVVDVRYHETLERYCIARDPYAPDVESLDLPATLATLTYVHRNDHFCDGALLEAVESGFLRRVLVRLRDLDDEIAGRGIIGFWRESDPLGFCSNWHPSGFEFAGVSFVTSEHWMMWQKACVMGDWDTASEILSAPTPQRAKELGAKVKPYSDDLWAEVREQLVYYGVREKFLQNPELARKLLSTGSTVLAEASPYDRIWGVSMKAEDSGFGDISKWRGSNLLGRICMRVRSDLRVLDGVGIRPEEISGGSQRLHGQLLAGPVGSMTPLQLSRIPSARPAVLCWARIAQHHACEVFPTVDAFLAHAGQASLGDLDNGFSTNMGGSLTVAGWHELLSQLAFLQAVGML